MVGPLLAQVSSGAGATGAEQRAGQLVTFNQPILEMSLR